jgi:hypothetical protein
MSSTNRWVKRDFLGAANLWYRSRCSAILLDWKWKIIRLARLFDCRRSETNIRNGSYNFGGQASSHISLCSFLSYWTFCFCILGHCNLLFFFFNEVRDAASNSAYYGYPKLWILRYPAHRYHAVPTPGFEPTTLWLRVPRRPNHSATTLHDSRFKKFCFLE